MNARELGLNVQANVNVKTVKMINLVTISIILSKNSQLINLTLLLLILINTSTTTSIFTKLYNKIKVLLLVTTNNKITEFLSNKSRLATKRRVLTNQSKI